MIKQNLILFAIIIPMCSAIFSACSFSPSTQDQDPQVTPQSSPAADGQSSPSPQNQDSIVAINTRHGQIVIKLFPQEAPNTVRNFLQKVKSDFYKGLTFHRVEPGFVVQGGDPLGNGTGGGRIPSEINTIPFKKGSLGLARGMEKEFSNDSQFFICLETETCQHLTNEYVNFGEVLSGQDVVSKIQVGDEIQNIIYQTK